MILKDIFAVEKDTILNKEYEEIYAKVREKYYGNNPISEYSHKSGYAQSTYIGKLKDGVKISELELSMYLDSGFSHFGGSSSISSDGSFKVVIYTD
jgi:hypothetical protein